MSVLFIVIDAAEGAVVIAVVVDGVVEVTRVVVVMAVVGVGVVEVIRVVLDIPIVVVVLVGVAVVTDVVVVVVVAAVIGVDIIAGVVDLVVALIVVVGRVVVVVVVVVGRAVVGAGVVGLVVALLVVVGIVDGAVEVGLAGVVVVERSTTMGGRKVYCGTTRPLTQTKQRTNFMMTCIKDYFHTTETQNTSFSLTPDQVKRGHVSLQLLQPAALSLYPTIKGVIFQLVKTFYVVCVHQLGLLTL